MRTGRLLTIYVLRAVIPYMVLAWVVLSAILFIQQAGRYSEIFFSPNIPASFAWQLTVALIPSVVAFTCPMAVLVGVIIGLSRMQNDNELVAIRASGVGNLSGVAPIIAVGLALSIFAIFVNAVGVPAAARLVRQVSVQSAIAKLESPIEPGVFNTEIAGYTIYVRRGDPESGSWRDVFVYSEEADGAVRLITSNNGRIDSSDGRSELVLDNAASTLITTSGANAKVVSEQVGAVRFAIKTRRDELAERISLVPMGPEELGLVDLWRFIRVSDGKERTDAQILFYRRIALSVAPFLFSLLGAALIFWVSGRGQRFGMGSALLILLVYFFITFAGEQLVRAGTFPAIIGSMLPLLATTGVVLALFFAGRGLSSRSLATVLQDWLARFDSTDASRRYRDRLLDLTTGIRDFDLLWDLSRYFLLGIAFLASIFLVFTTFELWRYAGSTPGGFWVLAKYLAFLFPYMYVQLAPTAVLMSVLATYVIRSRQNELVVWFSTGQSLYRLLVPCLALMLLLGIFNWAVQETILPSTNIVQDSLRLELRNRGAAASRSNRYWISAQNYIYSFIVEGRASDNELEALRECRRACDVRDLIVFHGEPEATRIRSLYRVPRAKWQGGGFTASEPGTVVDAEKGIVSDVLAGSRIDVGADPLLGMPLKPSQISSRT